MRQLTAVVVALLIAAVGVSLAPAVRATAQGSCNSYTPVQDDRGYLLYVPSIGTWSGRIDCLLGVGNDSPAVRVLQETLNQCYGNSLAVDGVFGPKTEEALIQAQRAENIPADGVYGPQTREHIKWRETFNLTRRTCGRL
jgi:hypothetical protein